MKSISTFLVLLSLVGCDSKPEGIPDDFYEEYKQLGAPKILYQCGQEVAYSAGMGINSTYNKLLKEAQDKCYDKKFTILKSQQFAQNK